MDFRLSAEEEALQHEVHDWLTRELGTTHDSDPEPMPPGYMPDREFELKMGETGWLAISWPEEYGGKGRPIAQQFIVEKEIALHGGNASDALTRDIIAPMIIAAASEDQKRRYLPGMARGAITACLGYSEPGSGSDFASLQTRAVRDGDDYVINGRKIWTSGAESSEYCWLAARTDSRRRRSTAASASSWCRWTRPASKCARSSTCSTRPGSTKSSSRTSASPPPTASARENEGWRVLTSALGVERITVYRAYLHWRTLVGHGPLGEGARQRRDHLGRRRLAAAPRPAAHGIRDRRAAPLERDPVPRARASTTERKRRWSSSSTQSSPSASTRPPWR